MSILLRTALVAAALLASASAVTALPLSISNTPNPDAQTFDKSADGGKTFWERMQRNGN